MRFFSITPPGNRSFTVQAMILLFALAIFPAMGHAQTLQSLKQKLKASTDKIAGSSASTEPDEKTIGDGIREALKVGAKNAVSHLSAPGVFLANARWTIPMPKELEKVAQRSIQLGFKKDVDEFVVSMNTAAEKAVPEALDIFVKAILAMTLTDVRTIWKGKDDEATQYFERQTRSDLVTVFRPVVGVVLDNTGVTRNYKKLVNRYNAIPLVKKVDFDLEGYITDGALKALFAVVAEEEGKIRKDPAARVTDLLKKVFGI